MTTARLERESASAVDGSNTNSMLVLTASAGALGILGAGWSFVELFYKHLAIAPDNYMAAAMGLSYWGW